LRGKSRKAARRQREDDMMNGVESLRMPTGLKVDFNDLVGDCAFLTFFRASGPLIAPYPFTEKEVLKASRAWKKYIVYVHTRVRNICFSCYLAPTSFAGERILTAASRSHSTSRISHDALAHSLISSNESKNFHSRAAAGWCSCVLPRKKISGGVTYSIVYAAWCVSTRYLDFMRRLDNVRHTFDMLRLFRTLSATFINVLNHWKMCLLRLRRWTGATPRIPNG